MNKNEKIVLNHIKSKGPLSMVALEENPPKGISSNVARCCAQLLTSKGYISINNDFKFEWKTNIKHIEKVNHPNHYKTAKFEVIDIIEEFDLNFRLGNTLKYILRAGKKDNYLEDLKKALWYLNREVEYNEKIR